MEGLHLDLRDQTAMVHFLAEWLPFAPAEIQKKADAIILEFDKSGLIETVEAAGFVKEFARSIYPMRFAMENFFKNEGALIEWDHVEKAVRRSTAHLMHRFKQATSCGSLEEMLGHDDFEITFGEDEKSEIVQTRHFVREDFINKHPKALEVLADEGKSILQNFEDEIMRLRNVAGGLPTLLQEELYSKITRFEDRVLFRGEHMAQEVLADELAYYLDQKELPISEKR